MIVDHPVFVTPHAMARWRERIGPSSDQEIIDAILVAFQTPLRVWRRGEPTNTFLVRANPVVGARLIRGEPRKGPWPVVTTILVGGTLARQLQSGVAEIRQEEPPAMPYPRTGRRKLRFPADELRRLYCEEKLSLRAIGRRFGVEHATIARHLAMLGIRSIATEGPPECHLSPAKRKQIKQARLDFLARYAGYRTPKWMAKRLGISVEHCRHLLWQNDIAPTMRDEFLTSGLAAELLGCSQQWVTRLCRRGVLRAHRNPGGKWWLVERSAVQEMIARLGRACQDPLLTRASSWPRVVLAKRRSRFTR